MKFMILCYDNEKAWEQEGTAVHESAIREAVAITQELAAKGQYKLASPLHPAATATRVRVRDGKTAVTDGPFAETREVLGGFYLIDVGSHEEALEVAKRHPGLRHGAAEVRAVLEIDGLPKS